MSCDRSTNSNNSNSIDTNQPNNHIINDYIILQKLGQGTFCKVKLGIHRPTNAKVAIKILKKKHLTQKDDFLHVQREFDMITSFSHHNVISVAEIIQNKDNFYIIMEYCQEGELFNYIVNKHQLTEQEASFFYYQLINGLEYIHSQGIVHRDLKPENLLLTKDHILKIIDFGLSNYYSKDLLSTPCGSPCYASPEMVSGFKYDGYKIDVWSTGIILYAMLCGYLPFEDTDNEKLFKKILRCKLIYPEYISEIAKDLMNRILVTDPMKRITIKEIKEHQFYLKGKEIFMQEFSYKPFISEILPLEDEELEREKALNGLKTESDLIEIEKHNKAFSNNINYTKTEQKKFSNYYTHHSEWNSLSVINPRNNQIQLQTNPNKENKLHNNNTNTNNHNHHVKRITIQTIAYRTKETKNSSKKQPKAHKSTTNTQYNTLKKIIINTDPNLLKIKNFSSNKHHQHNKKSLQYHPRKFSKQNNYIDRTHTKSHISQNSFADTSTPFMTDINITNYRNSTAITSIRSPQCTAKAYKKKVPTNSTKSNSKYEQTSLLYNLSHSKRSKGNSQIKVIKPTTRTPINTLHKKITKQELQFKELKLQNKIITNRNLTNYLKVQGDSERKNANSSSCEHSAFGIAKTKRKNTGKKKNEIIKEFKPLSLEKKRNSKSGIIITGNSCCTPSSLKNKVKNTNNCNSNTKHKITYRNNNLRQSAPTQIKGILLKELLEKITKKNKNES